MVKALSALWKKISNLTLPSFTTNVLARTIWEASLTLFGVIFSIIIARCLGPYGKGIINTIQQFGALAGSFVSPGLYSALQYFIASRKCTIKEGISNFIFFTLVYSFPLTFLILFLSPYFTHNILKGVPLHLLTVYIIFFLLSTHFAPTSIALSALQRFPQLTFIGIVQLFSKLLLLILFLIIIKMDVWGAFLPDWLLFPLDIYLSFYFLRDVIKISFFKPSLNKTLLKGLLNYGLKVFMIGLLGRIILRVDVFFVNYYQSPAAVGLYMTGVSYTEFIRLIPSAVGTVLFARVSATREEEAKNLTTLITRTYIIFIPLLSVFLLLLAHIIIPLFYGARFIPSIGVVGYLLPGVIALCFASPLGQYLNGRGFPEFNLYAGAMGVFLTLVGDFLLIPKMGIKGAALVSSIAYIATFLILLHFFHSYTKASLKEIFSPRKEDMLYILQVFKEKLASIKRKELK